MNKRSQLDPSRSRPNVLYGATSSRNCWRARRSRIAAPNGIVLAVLQTAVRQPPGPRVPLSRNSPFLSVQSGPEEDPTAMLKPALPRSRPPPRRTPGIRLERVPKNSYTTQPVPIFRGHGAWPRGQNPYIAYLQNLVADAVSEPGRRRAAAAFVTGGNTAGPARARNRPRTSPRPRSWQGLGAQPHATDRVSLS